MRGLPLSLWGEVDFQPERKVGGMAVAKHKARVFQGGRRSQPVRGCGGRQHGQCTRPVGSLGRGSNDWRRGWNEVVEE